SAGGYAGGGLTTDAGNNCRTLGSGDVACEIASEIGGRPRRGGTGGGCGRGGRGGVSADVDASGARGQVGGIEIGEPSAVAAMSAGDRVGEVRQCHNSR